jgi:co-chaperonin GroES (HSP10)
MHVVGYRVLVKPDPLEKKTESGIILEYASMEDRLQMAVTTGTVVALGNQAYKTKEVSPDGKPWCKVGDRIMFGKYAGKFITNPDDDEMYMVMNDVDVLAVLPPKG